MRVPAPPRLAAVHLAASLCALLPAAPAAAQLVPAGGPYLLFADPSAERTAGPARVLALGDGSFLALWQVGVEELRLGGRRFGADGPIGPEIGLGTVWLQDAAVAADGSLLVAGETAVHRLGLDGAAVAAPVVFDDGLVEPGAERCTWRGDGQATSAAVAPADGGGFAVAWPICVRFPAVPPPDDEWQALRFRRFDAVGAPLGPSSELAFAHRIWTPRLAADQDGGWLLTAVKLRLPESEWESGLRLAVHADGSLDALPDPERVWDVRAACLPGHRSLTVYTQTGWDWESDDGDCTGAFGLPADAAGDLGPPVDLPRDVRDCQHDARVAVLGEGFVTAWRTGRFDGRPAINPYHGVSLRRFDAAGRPLGDPLDLRLAPYAPWEWEWSHFDDLAAGGGLVAVVTRLWSQVYARLAAPVPPGPCAPGGGHLCLGGAAGDRFRVDAAFLNPYAGDRPGRGKAAPLTADTGAFWFFAPGNLELLVKVLDGRPVNGRFWVLAGAASTVEWWLTVTDTATGEQWGGAVAPHLFATVADTAAFPRPPAAPQPAAALPRPPGLPGTGEGVTVGGRYRLRVRWRDPRTGREGAGRGAAVAADSALFWYFAPANLELLVKVLDGRPVNGHAWVLWASATDVAFELEVVDTATGVDRRYVNAPYHMGGGADTTAFP